MTSCGRNLCGWVGGGLLQAGISSAIRFEEQDCVQDIACGEAWPCFSGILNTLDGHFDLMLDRESWLNAGLCPYSP